MRLCQIYIGFAFSFYFFLRVLSFFYLKIFQTNHLFEIHLREDIGLFIFLKLFYVQFSSFCRQHKTQFSFVLSTKPWKCDFFLVKNLTWATKSIFQQNFEVNQQTPSSSFFFIKNTHKHTFYNRFIDLFYFNSIIFNFVLFLVRRSCVYFIFGTAATTQVHAHTHTYAHKS